jgi:RNA polymerase sigma-B factor
MRIEAATQVLTRQSGRAPTPTELATHLEVEVETVLEGLEAATARNTRSLDAPIGSGDRGDGTEQSVVESVGAEDPGFEGVDAQLAGESAELDDREWRVLRMRLEQGMTQGEIGDALGVSQMQISRISRKALWKLLHAVRGGEGAPGPVPSTVDAEATR